MFISFSSGMLLQLSEILSGSYMNENDVSGKSHLQLQFLCDIVNNSEKT